jgi:hypothetical protein
MTTITDLFTTYAPEYLEKYPDLPQAHRKVIEASVHCRTGRYGSSVYQCQRCGQMHTINCSCGNRHCPQCPHHQTPQWREKPLDRPLPGPHFLITCTVPEELRDFVRSHQRVCYAALCKASAEALTLLATDPRFIGTDLPGFTGILHTWGRPLPYHPHRHSIVPGGGLSADRSAWLPSSAHFSVPVQALSPIYRKKCKDEREKAGLQDQINPTVWPIDWIVNSHTVGNGSSSLQYLAPSVFKVAISNSRIVRLQDHTVTFKYRKKGSSRSRTTSLDVLEFIRRFLQHGLPPGFMNVRHFGFMHSSCAIKTDAIRQMILPQSGAPPEQPEAKSDSPPGVYCPNCGGPLIFVKRMGPVSWDPS